ncbi:Adenosylcobinamide kinase / Adenosylcobinamide-phosphate guanylyltransferase [hydrothermal vent metagenome]|uniref:Adenosylcobinamide kinase n=1 Tax=hydrothermal vent metagenome TaxID=652676 RepID=A0A3B1ACK6_9ZZZZ
MLELVIGGARSGKSAYAEQRAKDSHHSVLYIATATADDDEMLHRIAFHKNTRPSGWQTIEEPIQLGKILTTLSNPSVPSEPVKPFVIVDCLTLWMTNILALELVQYENEITSFFEAIDSTTTSIIFVTNEIGMGVVPLGEETRRFIDESGRLHQRLAKQCHRVTQMIAGIENRIKDE